MTKDSLYKIITTKSGKPDYLAIGLYLHIKLQLKRKAEHNLETSYSHFSVNFKCSNETIRTKFVLLEKLGLIKRNFTTKTLASGAKVVNVLNLSLAEEVIA